MTGTKFIKTGDNYTVSPKNASTFYDELPPLNYIVEYSDRMGFYLKQTEIFTNTTKIYGDTNKIADRIINTFFDRPSSTGVLLTGEKGSGKSLLARILSIKLYSKLVPTIVINTGYVGEGFNKFLQDITQPCVILFDEFEKTYTRDKQEQMLSLLDGVYQSRKLFVLTCNNVYRIDDNMINRPGRIYYMKKFSGVTEEFITEYCNDRLNNKSHLPAIVNLSGLFSEFNFDMLKAVVEEINRYDEPPIEVVKYLNIEINVEKSKYDVILSVDGQVIKHTDTTINYYPDEGDGSVEIDYYLNEDTKFKDEQVVEFHKHEIVSITNKGSCIKFKHSEYDATLILNRRVKKDLNMFNLF